MNPFVLLATTAYTTSSSYNYPTETTTNTISDAISTISVPLALMIFFCFILMGIAIIFLVRWWMVQTAVFNIRQNISEIKDKMDQTHI
jgi:cell division protein FtsL